MGEIKLNDFDEFSYEVNYIDSFDNYDFSFFNYINIISTEKNIQFDIYFNKFLIDKNYVNDFINKHSDIQISLNNNAYNSIGNDLKYKPYEYQREIVDFILRKHSALIIACCGAGKTLIGICAYNELLKRKIINSKGLIIVKASLKEQWKNEVSKFSNLKAKIIETSSSINSKNNSKLKRLNAKLEKYKDTDKAKDIEKEIKALNKIIKNNFKEQFEDDTDLYIINYELLLNKDIKKRLKNMSFGFIFADEIHMIGNRTSKRAKAVHSLEADIKVGATATPITKDPNNIYSIFKFINPEIFPNAIEFENKYLLKNCFGRVNGINPYKKEKLKNLISEYIIKKDIKDIGSQLPKLLCIPIYVDLDEKQVQMHNKILEDIDEIKKEILRIKDNKLNLFEKIIDNNKEEKTSQKLKELDDRILSLVTCDQELANEPKLLLNSKSYMPYFVDIKENAKLNMLMELISQIIDSGEKVAIFSRFKRMQKVITDEVHKVIGDIEISYVNGDLNAKERYEEVYTKFRDNDEYKILLLSDSGAEGLNLSLCKYIIEYDLAKDHATQTQRQGRIQRADSIFDNVIVYQIIANESRDIMQQANVAKKESYNEIY